MEILVPQPIRTRPGGLSALLCQDGVITIESIRCLSMDYERYVVWQCTTESKFALVQ